MNSNKAKRIAKKPLCRVCESRILKFLERDKLSQHIGVIHDGHRRYARAEGLPDDDARYREVRRVPWSGGRLRRIEPGRGADGRLDCGHLGARGTLWLNDGVIEHTPAYTVTTVDTLRASDVYHGAFALGVAENRPIQDLVKRPAAAAALKCARFGGRAGVPSTNEVDAFLGCRSADR